MKKKSKIIFIVSIVTILAVTAVIFLSRSSDEIEVTAENVKYGPLRSIVSASGNILPHMAINISANIMGEIKKIAVDDGDRVEKGDLLIVIDSELYQAALKREEASMASADAELALATANYQRARRIYQEEPPESGKSLISQEEYEQLLAEYRVAQSSSNRVKAQVESAMANLEKTSIYSSIDGIVTSLNVEEGEVAVTGTMNNPGTVLMTISDLTRMQAEIKVDETDIVEVQIGQEAEVTIDAYPDTVFQGVVSEIGNSPIISSLGVGGDEAVDFKVVIDLIDPPDNLKPGLSTTADIITDTRDSALFIPIQALTMRIIEITDGNMDEQPESKEKIEKEGVFVVADGKAIFTPIKTGISDGMNIEVVSGLEEDNRVITGSFKTIRTLEDSSSVKTVDHLRSNGERGS
jgi:HlyD family secretion protein